MRYRPRFEMLEAREMLTTFEVVLPGDTGTGKGGAGDLRYCVARANAKHAAVTDSIVFEPQLGPSPVTILLEGNLVLKDVHPLFILGPTTSAVTISGDDRTQVFDIARGKVTVRNLAISHGNLKGGILNEAGATLTLTDCILDHDQGIGFGSGGGISNLGTATLTDCTFNQDVAEGKGEGGGFYNGGAARLTRCAFSNSSAFYGGGFDNVGGGKATLVDCIFANDSAGAGGGGFANKDGAATMTGCTFRYDSSGGAGGGIFNFSSVGSSAKLTLRQCSFGSDTAAGDGGGIYNSVATLSLTNSTLSDNSARDGAGIMNDVLTATLINCTLSNNVASNNGGGVQNTGNARVTNCTITNCSATNNGGGFNNNGGTATIVGCILSNDSTGTNGFGGGLQSSGTAILTRCTLNYDSAGADGGGIANAGVLTLSECGLDSDTAGQSGGGFDGFGTQILSKSTFSNDFAKIGAGMFVTSGSTTLSDCTLSNNIAGVQGGGIDSELNSTVTLVNCTLAYNSTGGPGGGIYLSTGHLDIFNTIVAGNTAASSPDMFVANQVPVGIAFGFILIGDGDGSTLSGPLVGTGANPIDPRLGVLKNNGGSTETLALLPGSPAIGNGDNAKAPATDQRGHTRKDQGAGKPKETTDIGSFEV
jgi:hypothetical protein